MGTTTSSLSQPVVLLVTPEKQARSHDHTAILSKAGFQVVNHTHEESSVAEIVRLEPRIHRGVGRGRA